MFLLQKRFAKDENCRDAPCIIVLMLLLANILACVLFAPPYASLLTVSFEMIFILVSVTFFCTTKQPFPVNRWAARYHHM